MVLAVGEASERLEGRELVEEELDVAGRRRPIDPVAILQNAGESRASPRH